MSLFVCLSPYLLPPLSVCLCLSLLFPLSQVLIAYSKKVVLVSWSALKKKIIRQYSYVDETLPVSPVSFKPWVARGWAEPVKARVVVDCLLVACIVQLQEVITCNVLIKRAFSRRILRMLTINTSGVDKLNDNLPRLTLCCFTSGSSWLEIIQDEIVSGINSDVLLQIWGFYITIHLK